MENRLINLSEKRKRNVQAKITRYLYKEIDWEQRLILIRGARGAGKTTMLL